MKKLTWKRQSHEKGLAGVCQGERGYELNYNKERLATVSVLYENGKWSRKIGYYWYARCDKLGIPLYNSCCDTPYATIDEAKSACKEYVVKHMKKD